MRTTCLLLATILAFCLAPPAHACAWDRDTLAMEKARFPDTVELIAGYFPRHSEAYYQWRNEQVLAIPVDQRTPDHYDDLGVGYDKLGQHQLAIDTMLAKAERFPSEGLYETHANLGTFYIHHGEFEQGVQYIASAIEINPDAHFGREVYQKLLVEYVLEQRAAGNTLPLEPGETAAWVDDLGAGFTSFVLEKQGIDRTDRKAMDTENEKAIKGILGMMRFGNYDSPILLEALGDLLKSQQFSAGVQRLAVRAYLKASYEVDDPAIAEQYRKKAKDAVGNQSNTDLATIESNLKDEVRKGEAYFAQIQADERDWIAAGKDLDVQFHKAYYDQPVTLPVSLTDRSSWTGPGLWVLIAALPLLVISVFVVLHLARRSRPAP